MFGGALNKQCVRRKEREGRSEYISSERRVEKGNADLMQGESNARVKRE